MDQTTTVKTGSVTKETELEIATKEYEAALKDMLANPLDPQKIVIFETANTHLYTVQDAYRIGAKLLLQHKKLDALIHRRNYTAYNENQTFNRR